MGTRKSKTESERVPGQAGSLYFEFVRAVSSHYLKPITWTGKAGSSKEKKMCPNTSAQITKLLDNWHQGDQKARDELIPLVYEELRRMARQRLWRQRPDHTLQSAALVNEAYLRLVQQKSPEWQNRAHFFGVAAQMMRNILVDYARQRLAVKRGGGAQRVTLETEFGPARQPEIDLLALDEGLKKLASLDAQQSRLVELRYFGGLSIEETAEAMGISPATVKREWATARAWLKRELKRNRGA
jgi:RNA polymerase sigma factor (TIGR02999 family)